LAAVGCGSSTAAKSAPSFEVESIEPPLKKVASADLKGKVVVIDFWATWCPPCRESMPTLDKLYKKYGKEGVQFVAVSAEDLADLRAFKPKSGVSYPLYRDPEGKMQSAFKVASIPRLVILDKNHNIVFDEEGAPMDVARIEQTLDSHK
jgi:thiol-disulfide isomerase/thioredoxin